MKKRFKYLIATSLLVLAVLALSACAGNWGTPYPSLDEQGYTVSVKFDANGGVFAGTSDVTVVDVFSPANAETNAKGEKEFSLLSPDDPLRKEGAFSISRNGYFLAGWYTERTLRTNESGAPVDEFGVPTSESNKEQGYTYSGLWNFDTDTLKLKIDGTETSETPVLTLYAAWIPYIDYEFYTESGDLIGTTELIDLDLPAWDENSGKMDLKRFPDRDGMTFDSAYLDTALTVPLTEKINGTDYVDYTTGTTSTEKIKIYTKWLEGDWFKIYNAKQFFNNSRLGGNYIICADLDFSDTVWSPTMATGKFTGTILGGGYKFSNITVVQGDASKTSGGLFGSIDEGATIENVTFENITYTIEAGSRMQGASFGVLAGSVSDSATLSGVAVTGTLYISENCYPQSDYKIGLLCGSGNTANIDLSGISCLPAEEGSEKIGIEVDENGTVTVTFNG